jgi:hypothetical protein
MIELRATEQAKEERVKLEELRKQDLLEYGTKDYFKSLGIIDVDENGFIVAFTRQNKGVKFLKAYKTTKKHKFGNDREYMIVTLWDRLKNRYVTTTLHRLIWIWNKGIIPKGYEVDHKDNNTLNNNLDNLQLLSKKENLRKKDIGRNQYTAGMSKEKILELREIRKQAKNKVENI